MNIQIKRKWFNKGFITIALMASFSHSSIASAIYPVGAKEGFFLGGNIGVASEIQSMTGLKGAFQLGYDYKINQYLSIGIVSGLDGFVYFDNHDGIYLVSVPLLASPNVVFSNGFNFGFGIGASGFYSNTSTDRDISIAPSIDASIGFKPINSINLTINYSKSFHIKVNNDRLNVYSISFGIKYTFGENPVNEDQLFASKFNVSQNLPWYR